MFPYLKLWSRSSVHFRVATAGAHSSAECCAGRVRLVGRRSSDKQVESWRQGEHCSECPSNRWNMNRVAERNKFEAGDKEHATQDVLNWWNQNCAAEQDEFWYTWSPVEGL